ncbi:MAG: DUF1232 domain-containing protein [Acidobacteria bacterium]|nr:DUF1232 domain-containing protein [Acidobacteriota bacterium]
MVNRKLIRAVRAALQLARRYARDRRKTRDLVDEADAKLIHHRGAMHRLRNDFLELLGMIRAWATGNYKVVPWKSILLGIAAVLYFVNPFDLVPDFLPLTGLVDDVAVLAYVLRSLQNDLARFRDWQQGQAEPPRASGS